MSDDASHVGIDDLQRLAGEVEDAVIRDNIYKEEVFERLIHLENVISDVRSALGLENSEVLKAAGVRDPLVILNSAIGHWDAKIQPEKLGSEEELISLLEGDFKIKINRTKAVFVRPDVQHPEMEKAGEEDQERHKHDYNRVALALQTLLHLKVDGEQIMLDDIDVTISKKPIGSFRKRPYWEINLKKFGIIVLVNNQYENRTFVGSYRSGNSYKDLLKTGKAELKLMPNVRHFKFESPEQFARDLVKAFEGVRLNQAIKPMDAAYFSDPANVKADLEAYAAVSGLSVEALTLTKESRAIPVLCANRETVRLNTYLLRAAGALNGVNYLAAPALQAETFKKLKQLIGLDVKIYPKMDTGYFIPSNVGKDLEAFAKVANVAVEDMNTEDISIDAVCSNGEPVNGKAYLYRAANGLNLVKKASRGSKKGLPALIALKKLCGIRIVEAPMDVAYFTDAVKVKNDLECYAEKIGKRVEDISVGNIAGEATVCSNGERVKGQKYLKRAAFYYGLAASVDEGASCQSQALKRLKETIGIRSIFPPMDVKYFSDEEKVRADLEIMANANNRSVEELSTTSEIVRKEYVFSTGEKMHGYVYLSRAAIGYKLAEESIGAGHVHASALAELKEKVGIKIETFAGMDAAYFRDTENVQRDLQAYADKVGIKIEELNTSNMSSNKTVCANGESVTGQAYLSRAALGLALTANPKNTGSFQKQTLDELKKTMGLELIKPMDAAYFNDNLAADFEEYSRVLGRPIPDFTVHAIEKVRIVCRNGESVMGETYLHRAAIVLGFAQNTRKANKDIINILENLKKRVLEKGSIEQRR